MLVRNILENLLLFFMKKKYLLHRRVNKSQRIKSLSRFFCAKCSIYLKSALSKKIDKYWINGKKTLN